MKRILMIAGASVGLLVIAALILPFLIPTSVYKGQIEKAASDALGVDVTIEGAPRLAFLPSISARVDGVEVANPDGFTAPHLLKAGAMRARLQLWPLLSRRIVVDEIILTDLDVNIEGQADGTYNVMVLANNSASEPDTPQTPETGETGGGVLATVDKARLRNAAIRVTGPDLETPIILTDFDGEARFTGLDQPIETKGNGILNGQKFDYDIALTTLESMLASTSSLLTAELKTDFFDISFDGSMVPILDNPTASELQGAFSFQSDTLAVIATLVGDALPPIAKLSNSLDVRGRATGSLEDELMLEFERLRFDATFGQVSYTGGLLVKNGDEITLDGAYDLLIETPKDVINALDLELPIRAEALKRLQIKGTANGPATAPRIDLDTAKLDADGLKTNYSGVIDLRDTSNPNFDGAFILEGQQLEQLLKDPSPLAAPLALLGSVNAQAKLQGPLNTLTLSEAKVVQQSALLETQFDGQFSLAENTPIAGTISFESNAPRTLLERLGNPLPEGDTLQEIAFSSTLSGTGDAPQLTDMSLKLDEMIATGALSAELARERPRFVANLNTQTLDLSPFLASDTSTASNANAIEDDWSDDPLDLAALKRLDGRLTITAEQIILDQIVLDDAQLVATLDNGRLNAAFDRDADTPGFRAFDGDWSGDVVIDASRSLPRMSVKAQADSIAAQKMLGDLTGYTGLSGLGDVSLDLTSSGNSLKALVGGLDGRFTSELDQGALSGINLAKMVRDASSLQELVRGGNLNLQSFRDAISPEAETDFSSFVGNLQFNQGIATITDLKLNNPVVAVVGTGSINLAARTIDIRLVPSVDVTAQGQGSQFGLNSIPIPVKISGPWTALSYGFDTGAVQAELTRRARAQAGAEIGNRIGGDVGNIIGGIVGGTPRSTPSSPPSEAQSEDANEDAAQSPEDILRERAVEGALGALFGRRGDPEDDDN